jgi:hypothetical protein
LVDADDDDASVEIETCDDITLDASQQQSLYQLKHSLGASTSLTIVNDGLWKAIDNWAKSFAAASALHLVTCAQVAPKSDLMSLTAPGSNRATLQKALEDEAIRVITTRQKQSAAKQALSFEKRATGCETFLKLDPSERAMLISKIRLTPNSFTLADIPAELDARLKRYISHESRLEIIERLMEWWDRRVVRSLLQAALRKIHKSELQARLEEFIAEHASKNLPDHFSQATPPALDTELGGVMERQIKLVKGGGSRVHRAAVLRWRARNQRARWMGRDFGLAAELDDFDKRLVEKWAEQHGPMCDDVEGQGEQEKCKAGLLILEWSHNTAPVVIPPIRRDWTEHFLVQGSYQQLADELKVGWHPKFRELLEPPKAPPNEDDQQEP